MQLVSQNDHPRCGKCLSQIQPTCSNQPLEQRKGGGDSLQFDSDSPRSTLTWDSRVWQWISFRFHEAFQSVHSGRGYQRQWWFRCTLQDPFIKVMFSLVNLSLPTLSLSLLTYFVRIRPPLWLTLNFLKCSRSSLEWYRGSTLGIKSQLAYSNHTFFHSPMESIANLIQYHGNIFAIHVRSDAVLNFFHKVAALQASLVSVSFFKIIKAPYYFEPPYTRSRNINSRRIILWFEIRPLLLIQDGPNPMPHYIQLLLQ